MQVTCNFCSNMQQQFWRAKRKVTSPFYMQTVFKPSDHEKLYTVFKIFQDLLYLKGKIW